MEYLANKNRYDNMIYNKCGNSGLKLPAISLGLWHNFGDITMYKTSLELTKCAFDNGITHFDIANRYGPSIGAAEKNFGRILRDGFNSYRDEIIISTKAGNPKFKGPYGDGGCKKYLVSSLDESLINMRIDYVDIYYHHRADTNTPIEESMQALDLLVRQGKALYIGLSNYNKEQTKEAISVLNSLGTHCLIHQPKYNMFDKTVEEGLLDVLESEGVGCITYSPLAGGLLTDRYFNGIPQDSRAVSGSTFFNESNVTESSLKKSKLLNEIANARGQKLSQMALAWILRKKVITSVLIGASKTMQIVEAVELLKNLEFSDSELDMIEVVLKQ
jgi:L-glyceraldehyde 3-phosphate reductase